MQFELYNEETWIHIFQRLDRKSIIKNVDTVKATLKKHYALGC